MNILHQIITDWVMGRPMGRHKQPSLLLYNLQLLNRPVCMPICILFDWWWVQPYFAHTIAKRRRLEVWKRETKKDKEEGWGGLLWGQPSPISWECLSNKRSICMAELSCNLSVIHFCGNENWGREINIADSIFHVILLSHI